ncbi:putative short-chain dehydrogenase reductase family [Diaporthe ampelina]|uniref:Putative short-chain dehydrogenase reductase family n=1 Tax=Diaporthe ampelina TaxID=1214573 RepID=A0A0G2FHC3_9PEZI|nr:putative short-chain dehydrogenase reductase family [Diaporthe ampelina]
MAARSKSVLVTGCSAGGLGAAIATNTAKTSGHHVFATARHTAKISEELSKLANVTVLELDITSAPSVTAAAKAVDDSGHGLDILVNNAGAGYASPIIEMDIEEAKQTYDINVWGTVRTIQVFVGLLIKSHGRIVNISTVGSVLNMPWICASRLTSKHTS